MSPGIGAAARIAFSGHEGTGSSRRHHPTGRLQLALLAERGRLAGRSHTSNRPVLPVPAARLSVEACKIGGSARGYQDCFAPLAPWQPRLRPFCSPAGPYVYTLPRWG